MTSKNIFSDFINKNFPDFLRYSGNKNNYYVKGGRVHDVIFKDKTGSIDWDIVATKEFKNMFVKFITLFSEKYNLTIIKKEHPPDKTYQLFQYGFEEYEDDDDKFIVDINMYIENYNSIPDDFFTLDGINYMTLEDFTNDIMTLYDKRYILIKDRLENDDQIEEIQENVNEIFNVDIERELYYDINKFIEYTLQLFIKKSKKYTKSELYLKIIENIYKSLYDISRDTKTRKELDKISIIINRIYEYLEYKKEYLDEQFRDYIENYLHILRSMIRLKMDLLEIPTFYKKFIKTAKRVDNIINIDWNNLSDNYKEYVVNLCKNNSF